MEIDYVLLGNMVAQGVITAVIVIAVLFTWSIIDTKKRRKRK